LTGDAADGGPEAGGGAAFLRRVQALAGQVFDTAERLVAQSDDDVAWLEDRDRSGRMLKVAPLSVAALLREKVLEDRTVVMTSATLAIGGTFEPVAQTVGLNGPPGEDGEWAGLDVGSPFDYGRQAMLYVARRLPPPGRDGPSPELLAELADLVGAAGGRTLGLFSSRRAAELAAAYLREHVETPILCQGDDGLTELGRRFQNDPTTSLVGTLSLWQGIDVPGPTCQLVVIDRIPFPRPDDPLASARQRAVDEAGGNGFMAVSATLAGLLLAQGSGRLIRTMADRGVVAVLDPRLATARYRDFLLRSLPPMWRTTDRDVALAALRRLDAEALA
jgi:ATP-dependent DNA helicase DinG